MPKRDAEFNLKPCKPEPTPEAKVSTHHNSTGFFCRGHLDFRPPEESSPDPRYCQDCYEVICSEVTDHSSGDWVPIAPGTTMVWDCHIEPGDTIQSIRFNDAGSERWLVVKEVEQQILNLLTLTVNDITKVVAKDGRGKSHVVPVEDVIAHRKGDENMTNKKLTPQENLVKARKTLAKLEKENKDKRAIGLWKSKVAQAEKLCEESGVDPRTVGATEAKTKATKERKPKPAPKEAALCLCGCGAMAKPGRNFLQGHDAKLASMIKKYDKGDIKKKDLSEAVQKMLAKGHPVLDKIRAHK